jgi:PHD/YefM family antitoxin component YafN of YafNO toxin-antitoxin module
MVHFKQGDGIMGTMRFISVRELRASTAKIEDMFADNGKILVTKNGKPAALMLQVDESSLEDTLADIRQMQARKALRELQKDAARNGTASMTMDEINAEITAAHKEKRLRKAG